MKNKLNQGILDNPTSTKKKDSVVRDMILWWEKKRIIYNALIIGLTIFLIYDFWDYPMRSIKGDQQVIFGAIIIVFLANICYTVSWGLGVLGNYLFKTKGLNSKGRWILFVLGTMFSLVCIDIYFVVEFDVLFAN